MMKLHVFSEKSGNFASEKKVPMIFIESKRKKLEDIEKQYPDAMIIDVTSHAKDEFVKFSPSKFGPCLGHRKGVYGEELLGYLTARKLIYLPCYKWVLENRLQKLVTAVRVISKNKPVVLLDYNTNSDVYDPKRPLSHASLIKAYIEGNYPE